MPSLTPRSLPRLSADTFLEGSLSTVPQRPGEEAGGCPVLGHGDTTPGAPTTQGALKLTSTLDRRAAAILRARSASVPTVRSLAFCVADPHYLG
jgi:hypothetical protein